MKPRSVEEIAQSTLEEVRGEVSPEKKEQGTIQKLRAIVKGVAEKVKKWGLPEGVDLERYKFITSMYEKLMPLSAKGELRLGKEWGRVFEGASEPKTSIQDSLDSKFDVLEYLLENYLPEDIVKDKDRYQQVRRFFIDDLGLLPALD